MPQQPNSPIRIQFGLRGWAAIAVAMAILGAVAFVAVGLLIFFLPLLLLAAVLYWLLPKPKIYRVGIPAAKRAKDAMIIDGEFRVAGTGTSEENFEPASKLKDQS